MTASDAPVDTVNGPVAAPAISLFTAPNVYGMHPDLEWTPRPDLLLPMFDAGWRRR